MKILAFDTSAKVTSVSIGNESSILGEINTNTRLTHSQSLMPMAKSLLDCMKLTFQDIDCFAVSTGPGSFTGLRIGISAIKGLAYGLNKPCISVSTLEALSRNLPEAEGIICAAMDARCNQVYTALFEGTPNNIVRITKDMAITVDELYEKLAPMKKNIFFVGDGAELCYNNLGKKLKYSYLAGEAVRYQKASSVIAVSREKFNAGKILTAEELIPIYLRLPQAERMLKKKNKTQEENHNEQ